MKTLNVLLEDVGKRIDQWLAKVQGSESRARWQQLIEQGYVLVNGQVVKSSIRLKQDDVITIKEAPVIDVPVVAENIPLDIVYEDADLLVISKAQGMVVHPAPGHATGTLVNALLYQVKDLSGIGGEKRPGIVHRLDKDTSGLMVVAKHDLAHRALAAQLSDHTMYRSYQALVRGVIKEHKGKIIAPIGRDPDDRLLMDVQADGKPSETAFTVLERFRRHTLVQCILKTGRTHQIRVHFDFIHHPLESDPLYQPQKNPLHPFGQLLHAETLTFIHPSTKKTMTFSSPLPQYFIEILEKLRT
jgi:23S rRNA pseudouridine1911/1915/1917 synthase